MTFFENKNMYTVIYNVLKVYLHEELIHRFTITYSVRLATLTGTSIIDKIFLSYRATRHSLSIFPHWKSLNEFR